MLYTNIIVYTPNKCLNTFSYMNVTDINENKKNIRLQMKQGIIMY